MKYYRITQQDIGDYGEIQPQGYYEKIGKDGDLVVRWVSGDVPLFPKSEIKETCFAKEPHLCLFSIACLLKEGWHHLYETEEKPDVDLKYSKWKRTLDCAFVGEVRYRRPVGVKKVKTLYLSQEDIQHIKTIQKNFFCWETLLFYIPKNYETLMEQLKGYLNK